MVERAPSSTDASFELLADAALALGHPVRRLLLDVLATASAPPGTLTKSSPAWPTLQVESSAVAKMPGVRSLARAVGCTPASLARHLVLLASLRVLTLGERRITLHAARYDELLSAQRSWLSDVASLHTAKHTASTSQPVFFSTASAWRFARN